MVYRGKPSKGCSKCRARKIKCDQTTPSCGQCARIGFHCPGYRNQIDLLFQNETSTIIGKAHKRNQKNASPTGHLVAWAAPSGRSGGALPDGKQHDSMAITTMLGVPPIGMGTAWALDDLSIKFFMTTYVGRDAAQKQFDHFPTMGRAESHLMPAIQAVGIAGYSKSTGSADLSYVARAKYVKALRLVNDALRQESSAKQDSTLAAVMVLGMFELIISPSRESLEAYQKHLDGAVQLAKLRGKTQFGTEMGVRLFQQLHLNVQFNCAVNRIPLPGALVELKKIAPPFSMGGDILCRFSELTMDWSALCAEVEASTTIHPIKIIEMVLDMDQTLLRFADELPVEWHFRVRNTDSHTDLVYNQTYHLYRDISVLQFWNQFRMIRSRLHKIVMHRACNQTILAAQPHLRSQLRTSVKTINQIFMDICATVPQIAGYTDKLVGDDIDKEIISPHLQAPLAYTQPFAPRDPSTGDGPRIISHFLGVQTSSDTGTPSPRPPTGAIQQMWPLMVICQASLTSPSMRQWILDRMQFITKSVNLEYAQQLAGMLFGTRAAEGSEEFISKLADATGIDVKTDIL